MGFETVVFGYVLLHPARRAHNEDAFSKYEFDERYPFSNIFSCIRPGYGGDVVSFAGSFKSLDEEWDEWEQKFEGLLYRIHGRAAMVQLDHEDGGIVRKVEYLCQGGWVPNAPASASTWIKWYYDKKGRPGGSTQVSRSS